MFRFNQVSRMALLAGGMLAATAAAAAQDAPKSTDASQSVIVDVPRVGVQSNAGSVQTTRTDNGDIIVTAAHYVPQGAQTASKTSIPLIQTPQSISVITRDQIDLLNFVDAQQAVRYTAGVFGESYGPDPRYDFLTVRGFTPKQYIDGLAVPATTTISSTGVDLYAFESLDILKGPASTLYGSAPPGGIVNETSRRPSDTFGGDAEFKYGTYGFGEFASSITGPVAPFLDVRMTALYRDAGSEVDDTRVQRMMLAPSATIKLGDSTRITLLGMYQYDRVTGGAGGYLPIYGTLLPNPNGRISPSTNLDAPGDLFVRRQYSGGFEAEHRFGNNITFTSNTRWSHYSETTPVGLYSGSVGFVTVDAANPGDPANFQTVQQSNYTYAETVDSFATDNRLSATVKTGAITQKLLVGVDYRNVRNLAAYNFVGAGTLNVFDPVYNPADAQQIGYPTRYNQQKLQQTGIYAQDQIGIGNLYLTAGGRYDWVNANSALNVYAPVTSDPDYVGQNQHKFTYHLGANYVTAIGIAPYVSYSTSFEPVLGTDANTLQPLKPTTSSQWEGGIKYDARGLPSDIKLFATAAIFDIREKNFVTAQNGQTYLGATVQGGLVEVYGGEFELVARIHDQLSLNASYSYTHSEVKSSPNAPGDVGFPLPVTPKNKASFFADYTFQKSVLAGFGLGAGVRYTSSSAGGLPSTTYPQLIVGEPIVTGEAVLFDATLHYDLPHWRIAVNGSNLFNDVYVARCSGIYGCVYGAGREVIGTISFKF